jgi:hypothetical protein
MTGCRLTSLIPAMMRSLSSCFDSTLMWRRTKRANLEKKPSMRLSQEPCFGVKVNSNLPVGRVASQVGRIKELEEFDELSTAVAIPDQRMDFAGEQINPGQEAHRAKAFVHMVTREGRVDAGATATNWGPWLRWPGCPAFHRKRGSPLVYLLYCACAF